MALVVLQAGACVRFYFSAVGLDGHFYFHLCILVYVFLISSLTHLSILVQMLIGLFSNIKRL